MGRARILVIDDERAVRDLISDALNIEGHEVFTAENGKEGLDLIGHYRFDLVFCDLRMPEMDGQALYEEIQRDHPQVLKRIVFVTAQALRPIPARNRDPGHREALHPEPASSGRH
jgi:CheY-like chemotaxis protein